MRYFGRTHAIGSLAATAWIGSIVMALGGPPPHGNGLGKFLDASNYQFCLNDQACKDAGTKYLKAIGVLDSQGNPTAARGNLTAWKNTVGFNAKLSVATAHALYFNKNELGFARDANCVTHQVGVNPGVTTIACYISNYSDAAPGWPGGNPQKSIQLAKAANPQPLFTVAMEVHFTSGLNPLQAGAPQVAFIAYAPDGSPMPAVAFDNEGLKPVPGVCVACHATWFHADTNLIDNATFLPFNSAQFIEEEQRQILGKPPIRRIGDPQHEAFRMLNSMVMNSQPSQQVKDLIDGWYKHCGGVFNINCSLDDNFLPSAKCTGTHKGETCGWTVANDTLNAKGLYQQVIRPFCRNCHIANPGALNVQSLEDFTSGKQSIQQAIFTDHGMPYAEMAYYLFWNDSMSSQSSQQVQNFLNSIP